MDSIRVQGGVPLQGKVRIQGSKNAALPMMAACIMTSGQVILENVPKIADVYGMARILEHLGCTVRWEQGCVRIDSGKASVEDIQGEMAASMRSSIFALGPLLARFGKAGLDYPGGCVIGKRPIDLHLKALGEMGVAFETKGERLLASAPKGIRPAEIVLDFPSVGATENILMAAVAAEGETRIRGAAREPEIEALCDFLNACGASIRGMGSGELVIRGGRKLQGTSFVIPPDRIVAGTYLLAGFAAGGTIYLEEAPARHMEAVLNVAEKMGAGITITEEGVYAQYPDRPGKLPALKTGVYPGFPTDLQSIALSVRCTGEGASFIRETIFENRFRIVKELQAMGASIELLDPETVWVKGVATLYGKEIEARELRGGAALVVAALGANGETVISGKRFIDRGYENICRDLRELGARIVSG